MSRLEKKLTGLLGKASKQFDLLEPNDRVMVGVSGGKDSYTMLYLLREIQKRTPFDFEIIAVNLDQGQPGFPAHVLEEFFKSEGFEYKMLKRDTYSIVLDKIPAGKTYCSLCSRLRRGILYNAAAEMGCTKIALGHHRDDVITTLMLNLLYAGQIKAMPPKLTSDDGRNIVIRPMVFIDESDIIEFAKEKEFPIIPCDLCGSQQNLQRKQVSAMINELHAANNNVKGSLFSSLANVRPTHLFDMPLLDMWRQMDLPAPAASHDGWDTLGESVEVT